MANNIEKTYSLAVIAPKPTQVVANIPDSTPFVGPETLERRLGRRFELRLGANESLFGPSPRAVAAMNAAAHLAHFYGDPEGFELRTEIATRHGCSVENVVLASGIDELLMLFCRAFVAPGDSVATTRGSYPTFEYAARSVGARIETCAYEAFRVDLVSLAKLARSRSAKIAYIANPDNPTGSWHSPLQLASLDLDPGKLLLLDEAYADFAPQLAKFDPEDPSVVRLRTFSKAHGMAGIRIGYALGHADHVRTLDKLRLHFGVSSVAQAGALAALGDEGHLDWVVKETESARSWLAESLRQMGFDSIPSHTNFLAIDLGDAERAQNCLLRHRELGVFIRKPSLPPLDGHIRVSIGPMPVMQEFVARFRAVYSGCMKG
jgi:histidinol-phosphate aminotransferase